MATDTERDNESGATETGDFEKSVSIEFQYSLETDHLRGVRTGKDIIVVGRVDTGSIVRLLDKVADIQCKMGKWGKSRMHKKNAFGM